MSSRGRALPKAVAILLIAAPVAVWAQGATSDPAMVRYRSLTSILPKACRAENGSDEIIVCANQKLRDSQKVPYIDQLRVGDRPRLALGEVAPLNLAPPCPPRGCPCPPTECGIRYLFIKLSGE
jgi:hypothetical protein